MFIPSLGKLCLFLLPLLYHLISRKHLLVFATSWFRQESFPWSINGTGLLLLSFIYFAGLWVFSARCVFILSAKQHQICCTWLPLPAPGLFFNRTCLRLSKRIHLRSHINSPSFLIKCYRSCPRTFGGRAGNGPCCLVSVRDCWEASDLLWKMQQPAPLRVAVVKLWSDIYLKDEYVPSNNFYFPRSILTTLI